MSIHTLIIWVRHLRKIAAFKVSTRTAVIILMLIGSWVATINLDIPVEDMLGDKLIHIIVFFGFAFLMDLSTSKEPFWLWKVLPLFMYGVFVEIIQYFTPDRTFSLLDMVADLTGIVLYFCLKFILIWFDSRRA